MNKWTISPDLDRDEQAKALELFASFPLALLADRKLAAAGLVLAEALAVRWRETEEGSFYAHIDRLDEPLLDALAYDFKVDWWDPNYTTEEKRRTLADSWHVHKILGTKSAVETAIRDIYPKTDVIEWFEYEDGKPYHFKLNIDLTDTFGDETRPWRVLERVNFYKSLRSHMDKIVFTMQVKPAKLCVGGSFGIASAVGVSVAADEVAFRQTVFVGGSLGSQASIGPSEEKDSFDFRHEISVGGSVGTDASIRAAAGADTPKAQASLYAGGAAGILSSAGVSDEPDAPAFSEKLSTGGSAGVDAAAGAADRPDALVFSKTLSAGGTVSGQASLPVSEDTVQPPATTIIRNGGVCTIISHLSKGE